MEATQDFTSTSSIDHQAIPLPDTKGIVSTSGIRMKCGSTNHQSMGQVRRITIDPRQAPKPERPRSSRDRSIEKTRGLHKKCAVMDTTLP